MTTTVARAFFAVTAIVTILLRSHAEAFVVVSKSNDPNAVTAAAASSFQWTPLVVSSFADSATSPPASRGATIQLRMGLLDSVLSRFGNNNNNNKDDNTNNTNNINNNNNDDDDDEGDFVKLEQMNDQFFGPGPAVLLYQFPDAIDDDEVRDILLDGAPQATTKGISMARIAFLESPTKKRYSLHNDGSGGNSNSDLIDLSLRDALEQVIGQPTTTPSGSALQQQQQPTPPSMEGCPVVIFSGFSNSEIMDSYNILGEELYKETGSYGRGQYLACATAVPNAMGKSLRQVLSEISGDHAEAMQTSEE